MERKISVRHFRKFDYTSRGCPLSKSFRKCYTRHWQFAEIETRILHRMDSALSFLEN